MSERICDVRWEGPFPWERRADHLTQDHVLYALYGTHHLYGQDALLYIGMTEVDLGARLTGHVRWVKDEYDTMMLKAASVGVFQNIEAWWKAWNPDTRYGRVEGQVVKDIEALLIYAHQPAYNTQGKNSFDSQGGPLRLFNTGRPGLLLPELSSAYYEE